ncbi:unconventional prefoldin RPB5 interactor-like protein [Episyrphus balteatus]|uniref:unconventional prefoldin RPB5 interactor-like protein n=1 Tax=Episyrphus balteatus TaxID=286459 RepID=UPI0024852EA5|nr:unconventional prefoldin RPB5 interactor-like protein [Episyrphus balteatus]
MLQSIEKRENVLREALEQNEKEVEQWKSFVEENETAIKNMEMFSKMLTVDVMVPFGKKAFFPGKIVHTNEVLVAHYQGYFSECSTYVATEICKQRMENGKKRLEELEGEKDLFQNKLEKPYLDGVLPNMNEKEIIEEYDEENEKIWREQHRQRVKEAKLKERKEREEIMCKPDERDVFKSLEEDERTIDELDEELMELETEYANETKELLNKLIAGEISLPPPKKRIAHGSAVKQDDTIKFDKLNLKNDYQSELTTNSPEVCKNKIDSLDDGNESDTSNSDIPEEIRLIEEQAAFLPQEDRFGFYQYQLQIVDQKLSQRTFSNSKELEEKLHLFKVRDHLEELLEEASPIDLDSEPIIETEEILDNDSKNVPKRRISFAMENQMLEFRKNESVAQMLPNTTTKENIPNRDIIRLDDHIPCEEQTTETEEKKVEALEEKRKTILEKVEENLKTNNLEDADLVNKIIGSSANHIQTLHIHFKHSSNTRTSSDTIKTEIPTNPADFFSLFDKIVDSDLNKNADNNFYLKESDRERAYIDVRSEFLAPNNKQLEDIQSKSILKNKSAVQRETHVLENEEKENIQKKRPKKPKQEEEYLSAYNKAVGDVIENPTKPDPLPEVKFVDMHAPKKRISRFKQMRNEKN